VRARAGWDANDSDRRDEPLSAARSARREARDPLVLASP
jgi:hypothetical protein